jgi:hypothetical protein
MKTDLATCLGEDPGQRKFIALESEGFIQRTNLGYQQKNTGVT